MKNLIILKILILLIVQIANCQENNYRSGIFLHHSTGGCIWGPNESATSVPQQMNLYNISHGYTGDHAVSLNETWYPDWNDNEWCTWHSIFETDAPEEISGFLSSNKIVMIKSCFPSSEIWSIGDDNDTLDPCNKSIANYKWHWRHILKVMENHPENFFVIWTNAPLEQYSTSPDQAARANSFCYWAKDTLAQGLDPVYGVFPRNVYVFDFFHKLANSNGILPAYYAAGPWDSHPNAAATALVAPQLVNEIFDAAIAYETGVTLNIRAFLEGPFNGTQMNTSLNPSMIPLNQPYCPALPYFGTVIPEWYYSGTESIASVPNSDVVDWVYVELRDATHAAMATKAATVAGSAAFILKNGNIVDLDGTSLLSFPVTITNNLYVAVWHRNHLGVLSANALTQTGGVYSYNFSTAAGQAYGGSTGHKQLVAGIWGLVSGDGNGDGVVSNTDKNNVWKIQSGQSGYKAADFSMNGQVDNIDKTNKWKPNSGAGSQVPDSMTPPGGYKSLIPN